MSSNGTKQLPLFSYAVENTAPTAAGSGQRDPRDFYPSPVGLVSAALDLIPTTPRTVLDPCAGTGVWGLVARRKWSEADITGVDLYFPNRAVGYNRWLHGSFFDHKGNYDACIMNPPYGKAAIAFIRHGRACLNEGGSLIALVLIGLLAAQSRLMFWTEEYAPQAVYILPRRPSFRGAGGGSGTDKYNYMIALWGSESNPHDPALRWLSWNYSPEDL